MTSSKQSDADLTTEPLPVPKQAWVKPEIKALDISETHRVSRRGGDGCRFVDCTRS